jgi:hypothetical protein
MCNISYGAEDLNLLLQGRCPLKCISSTKCTVYLRILSLSPFQQIHEDQLSLCSCTRNKYDQDRSVSVFRAMSAAGMYFLSGGGFTHVAPATTNSIVFALVEPDNMPTKTVVAVIMIKSRAVRSTRQLQIMTGPRRSVIMSGVIKIRAVRMVDDFGDMRTFGSLERLKRRFYNNFSHYLSCSHTYSTHLIKALAETS